MSPEARRGNLPRSTTTLVGRAEVLPELAALVRSRQLVTLSGVGGVGKTRLALAVGAELADEFPDGMWLVELAPVGNPDAVPDAIATALGITPQGGARVIDTVAEAVAGRRLLILVDNCEHVLAAAAAAIGEILARSDVPRILATSREHLACRGRRSWPCPPLTVDGGVTSDAVTLFAERARAVRQGFGIFDEQTADAVIEICETLDGLPLGIELAAARMAAMSAVEVRDRLGDRFRLLTGPELGPDRQATLRHAMAWSYDLLDDDERATLRTASVFAGGFDLPALCAVAEASDDVEVLRLLDSLVRKSLVSAHHGSAQTRYSLFETIRTFADERLAEAAERDAARDRHAAYFAGEAVRAVGAVERSRVAHPGRLGADGAGEPAVGVPVERRSRSRRGGHRHRRARRSDGVLGGAVRDHRVGRVAARSGDRGPMSGGFPGCTPRPGMRASSDAPRSRPRTPTGRPCWRAGRATSRASPATRRSSRRSDRSTAGTWIATSS